jgi:hypothetical protein
MKLTQYLYWTPVISSPRSWDALLLIFTSRLYGDPDKVSQLRIAAIFSKALDKIVYAV